MQNVITILYFYSTYTLQSGETFIIYHQHYFNEHVSHHPLNLAEVWAKC